MNTTKGTKTNVPFYLGITPEQERKGVKPHYLHPDVIATLPWWMPRNVDPDPPQWLKDSMNTTNGTLSNNSFTSEFSSENKGLKNGKNKTSQKKKSWPKTYVFR